jgi:hypothetical protein
MNYNQISDNQKKGIILIIGGILSLFILPDMLRMIGLDTLYLWLEYEHLKYIVALIIIGLGIKTLMSKDSVSDQDDATIDSRQATVASEQGKQTKVVNVTLTGGIIGILSLSPLNTLNKIIKREGANGWSVIQIIPAESGNIFLTILRLLVLVLTIFLYTTVNGYYIVMEKK